MVFFFFFNDTATTDIYTLSLHDALPISRVGLGRLDRQRRPRLTATARSMSPTIGWFGSTPLSRMQTRRSEEHTSELQSRLHLVCRLLLEKKKSMITTFCANLRFPIVHTD